jgi:predicted nucleotidyltransferase component of viral defense system
VFKGGTALRRCYFRGYRYSEDLDFSADDQPNGREKIWERLWQQRLENQVRDLPAFDGVWRRVIRSLQQADY